MEIEELREEMKKEHKKIQETLEQIYSFLVALRTGDLGKGDF